MAHVADAAKEEVGGVFAGRLRSGEVEARNIPERLLQGAVPAALDHLGGDHRDIGRRLGDSLALPGRSHHLELHQVLQTHVQQIVQIVTGGVNRFRQRAEEGKSGAQNRDSTRHPSHSIYVG